MTAIKSFEKPLTPEEEVYYLNLLKNENNKEAKEVLVQRNMRLVAHISKKYNNSGEELDDLISIGTIGLIKAIDTFNVDKGIRLATYASKCIENEILMNIRSNKKNKMQVSLQDPIGVDKEGNAISLIDILGTDEDYVVDKVELKMKISKLYEKIEKLERLGIFNQWKYNTERANETFNIECPDFSMTNEERMNNLLDVDCCFHRFLAISFPFYNTPEGAVFWENIAKK